MMLLALDMLVRRDTPVFSRRPGDDRNRLGSSAGN